MMNKKTPDSASDSFTSRINNQNNSNSEIDFDQTASSPSDASGTENNSPAPPDDADAPENREASNTKRKSPSDYSNSYHKSGPNPKEKSSVLRRVGSITLGVCLIAAGVFFLLYFFMPAFPWELVLKVAPAAGLILLGCEVLFFAARPGRWKYDFLSVFLCLLMMAGCFCLSLLPLFWAEIDPARSQQMDQLCESWQNEIYTVLSEEVPDLRIRTLHGDLDLDYGAQLPETVQDAVAINCSFLRVELRGPYDNASDFAASCRQLTDVLKAHNLCPEQMRLLYNDPEGTGCRFELCLEGVVEQGWTAEEMAAETHQTNYRQDLEKGTGPDLEEENLPESAGYEEASV